MVGRLREDDIRAALTYAGEDQLRASGGASTISLPGILGNVARKEMLRGYNSVVGAVPQIARRATATDYKPFYMYRLNTEGLLQQIGADGELKSMELSEEQYTSWVYPWGRKLQMTEVMLRNDDAGAFNDLARLFGRISQLTLEKQGITALLANQAAFWTSVKGNRLANGAPSQRIQMHAIDVIRSIGVLEVRRRQSIRLEQTYVQRHGHIGVLVFHPREIPHQHPADLTVDRLGLDGGGQRSALAGDFPPLRPGTLDERVEDWVAGRRFEPGTVVDDILDPDTQHPLDQGIVGPFVAGPRADAAPNLRKQCCIGIFEVGQRPEIVPGDRRLIGRLDLPGLAQSRVPASPILTRGGRRKGRGDPMH